MSPATCGETIGNAQVWLRVAWRYLDCAAITPDNKQARQRRRLCRRRGAYSLGVDLGTTFVAAAVAHGSRVEMFTLGDRSVVTPAVVYARDDGSIVTGEAAHRRAVSNPDRVGREFKRRLGDPTPVMLGGAPHAVTALLGALLGDVVARVTETEGAPPARSC